MDKNELVKKIQILAKDILLATSSKKLLEKIGNYCKNDNYKIVIDEYPCF